MVFLSLGIFMVGTVLVLSRAAPHGRVRLWLAAAALLVLVVAGALVLGWLNDVPSVARVVVAGVALAGPGVLVPSALLSLGSPASTPKRALAMALVGTCLGLACGFLIVVFGLGVW